jgi:hypothetical protein
VVPVRGSSGVALASGLYWYLKYYCNASVTWGENGTGDNLVRTTHHAPTGPWPVGVRGTLNWLIE